ncbi:hypothetical protein F7018_09155 [Tenacibaculum aiptasiae]|uniref:DUF3108 domain-containing protein n=1 Tax=Tenacibaculum aiptasiae TaxID=426481 RepID=A0A7J5AMY9_9FLAO|nr:DUF6134 family protein [Tenacibaculum aiptasiae]KAB1158339.1 hypothetical protein F7018_09155 [Tenacibaculum aiptasiae]
MKTKFQKIIIVLLLINITQVCSQEYVYDIKIFGKKIGTVITNRIQEDGKTIYKTSSFSSIRFFGKKEITTYIETVYKNNILQSSFYEVKKNKKIREKAILKYRKNKYHIITNGKEIYHDKPIFKSTVMLTHNKPKNKEVVFEEVKGFYKIVSKINENKFDLINPKSRYKDTYIYNKDGILKKCIIRRNFFDIKMILRKG